MTTDIEHWFFTISYPRVACIEYPAHPLIRTHRTYTLTLTVGGRCRASNACPRSGGLSNGVSCQFEWIRCISFTFTRLNTLGITPPVPISFEERILSRIGQTSSPPPSIINISLNFHPTTDRATWRSESTNAFSSMKIENKIFRNCIELNNERMLRRRYDQTRLDGKRIYVRSGSTYRDHEQRFSVRITLGKDWKKERAPSQTVFFDQSKSCGRKERPRYCSSFS